MRTYAPYSHTCGTLTSICHNTKNIRTHTNAHIHGLISTRVEPSQSYAITHRNTRTPTNTHTCAHTQPHIHIWNPRGICHKHTQKHAHQQPPLPHTPHQHTTPFPLQTHAQNTNTYVQNTNTYVQNTNAYVQNTHANLALQQHLSSKH